MTPREKYRRARAFARAGKRLDDYARRVGWKPSDPGNLGNLGELSRHEAHAWGRLPDTMRAAITNPGGPDHERTA